MTPADAFPFASSVSRTMQVDHTVPYDAGGESGRGQLRAHDPAAPPDQDLRRWQVRQPFPGIYLWRDPHGAYYFVDHTGTRRLRNRKSKRKQERPKPLAVELWHSPFRPENHATSKALRSQP